MRFFHRALPLALLLASCDPGNEIIKPAPACVARLPPTGFPGPGVLHLDAPSPTGPITPAPHRGAPPLVVDEPNVMTSPHIVSLVANDDPLKDTLLAFGDDVPASAWWTAVSSEFGVGPLRPSSRVVGPPQSGPITGAEMIAYAMKYGPPPDGNTIYLLYLSPGVEVIGDNGAQNCGCAYFAGAHFQLASGSNDAFAWIQRCSSAPEALTITASHEILESATDPGKGGYLAPSGSEPWTKSVWASIQDGGNELGDFCSGTRVHEGAWEYQRSFSNLAAQKGDDFCVPALAEPYYNVTVEQDWYPVASGGSVTIDVTGWATGPREDWFLIPRLASASQIGFTTAIESDESASASGVTFYGINNGKTATLTVTAPTAPAGTHAVVRILSVPSAPGNDISHFWPVGVFIQ